jgi:hypothetical protein
VALSLVPGNNFTSGQARNKITSEALQAIISIKYVEVLKGSRLDSEIKIIMPVL